MTEEPLPPAATRASRRTIRGDDIALWDRPGGGVAILLLHGNSASKEVFRELFAAKALSDHRMVAFDFPGCGDSADAHTPEETYTLPAFGALIAAAVGALGLDRFVLAGWSLGGHFAIEALLHGVTPKGIALTGTPPCGPDPAEIAATFLPVPGSEVTSMENPSPDEMEAFLHLVYAPSQPTAELSRAALRADGRLRRRLFAHIFATPELEPQRATIAGWPGPFALIQGRHEPFFRAGEVDALAWRNLWRGATQWIDAAGHAPMYSHPDAYARILKAFVDDVAPA